MRNLTAALAFALLCHATAAHADAMSKSAIQGPLNAAYTKYASLQEGRNAEYMPALADVDPNIYGIALVTTDSKVHSAGAVTSEVSMQSISKVFTLAKVIEESGPQAIVDNMGGRRDRPGLQLDHRDRAEQGRRDEPAR